MTDREDEVVVVGAGAVGSTIAFELSRAGMQVRLIDAGEGPGAGCSYANAGLLSPSHVESMATPTNVLLGLRYLLASSSPFRLSPRPSLVPWLTSFMVAARPRHAAAMTTRLRSMACRSLALHLAYPEQGIRTGASRTGSLDVYTTERRWARAIREVPEEAQLTASQIAEACPGLSGAVGGVLRQEDATCNTLQYVTAMIDAARDNGTEVHWGTEVVDLTESEGRIAAVILSDGTRLKPRHVVLAAGLGTDYLCRKVGLRVPLQPATGYVIDVPRGDEHPGRPVTLKEPKVVITPFDHTLRAAGTLDLTGRPGVVKPHRLEAVREAASNALPGVDWNHTVDTWAGDRPSTNDGMPIIGTSRHVEGVVVAAGHGMWGLVLAPITAEWVLRGLTDDPSALSDPSLSPDRFTRRRRRTKARRTRKTRASPVRQAGVRHLH